MFPWLGIIWMLLIFPSGHLEGRLERYTAMALAALCAIAVFSFLFSLEPMEATGLPSPLAIDWLSHVTSWSVTAGFVSVLLVTLVAILSMTRRWRRSSGVERHQYRWLLLGAAIFLVILSMGNVLPEDNEAMYLWVAGGMAIPVSVGVAVTRYRLFEIDRLLSRTVSYTLIVGLLAALFARTSRRRRHRRRLDQGGVGDDGAHLGGDLVQALRSNCSWPLAWGWVAWLAVVAG